MEQIILFFCRPCSLNCDLAVLMLVRNCSWAGVVTVALIFFSPGILLPPISPKQDSRATTVLTCTCVGIHPGRVEPVLPIALTTSRTEALQARRFGASSLDTFTQSFLHRAWPKTRGPESGSRSALIVVAHDLSWPPSRLHHVRGGVGRRRSLISSPPRRLAA